MKNINSLPGRIFREDFSSRASVLKNTQTVNNITFADDCIELNGTDSYIIYNSKYDVNYYNGILSLRVKFKFSTSQANKGIIGNWNSTGRNFGFFVSASDSNKIEFILYDTNFHKVQSNDELNDGEEHELVGVLDGTNIFMYVDGVKQTDTNTYDADNIELADINFNIGRYNEMNNKCFEGDFCFWELYNRGLSSEEVELLYKGKVDRELSPENTLLDFQSINGVIEDKSGKNTLTPTDVSIKKNGTFYSSEFNGTSSKIDTGSDFIGTKAVTVMGWIYLYSYGESALGYIITNDKFIIAHYSVNDNLFIYSDNITAIVSANNSISLNKWQFISVTRESDGTGNVYIGDKKTAPTLSGDANQDSGTPEAGTSNIIVGDRDIGGIAFDGKIPLLNVKQGILSTEQITQFWSNTRWKV